VGRSEDLREAEGILQAVLPNAEIGGVRFGRTFVLLFEYYEYPVRIQCWEIYLKIEARFAVYLTPPERLPTGADELSELSLTQKVAAVAGLRGQLIREVQLGEDTAHLIITFQTGAVLFVSGNDQLYESWEFGVVGAPPEREYLVIAVPGGGATCFAGT
jgi:hypothetical protein